MIWIMAGLTLISSMFSKVAGHFWPEEEGIFAVLGLVWVVNGKGNCYLKFFESRWLMRNGWLKRGRRGGRSNASRGKNLSIFIFKDSRWRGGSQASWRKTDRIDNISHLLWRQMLHVQFIQAGTQHGQSSIGRPCTGIAVQCHWIITIEGTWCYSHFFENLPTITYIDWRTLGASLEGAELLFWIHHNFELAYLKSFDLDVRWIGWLCIVNGAAWIDKRWRWIASSTSCGCFNCNGILIESVTYINDNSARW